MWFVHYVVIKKYHQYHHKHLITIIIYLLPSRITSACNVALDVETTHIIFTIGLAVACGLQTNIISLTDTAFSLTVALTIVTKIKITTIRSTA